MSHSPIAAIILAAGQGTRMKSALPKVLHKIAGLEMIGHVTAAASALAPERLSVVIGAHGEQIKTYLGEHASNAAIAVQDPPQGTGDGVAKAVPHLDGFSGAVLVLYADTPLIEPSTLQALVREIEEGASVAVLGFTPPEPGAYGRLKRDDDGTLAAIVEAKDASPDEYAITLCNSGVMAFDAKFLSAHIGDLDNKNAKGEYYLTDLVAIARQHGKSCGIVEGDNDEVIGVNSRIELAEAEAIFQFNARVSAMENGATLTDPDTVYFSHDTKIGKDVIIGPNVIFGTGVSVADNVEVKPFSHLEGTNIGEGASIGPFARLRPGANLQAGAKIGNFVEIKKADIGAGAKVSHLSYIGDATIGADANIGAGTITCNYDGYAKHHTSIGEGAFIGSNSSLVAPVKIGERAYVGSGSVITKNVVDGDLAVARGRQAAISGWAEKFHQTHAKKANKESSDKNE